MKRLIPLTVMVAPAFFAAGGAYAQTTQTNTTGSAGCAAITQAAATGAANRIAADGQLIQQPQSVVNLTCLNSIFSSTGLNLVTNLLNPQTLLNAITNQICQAVKQEWTSLIGSATCGLTITGFNLGFGGLGGGLSCPKLTFGGGGPPLGSIGLGVGPARNLYINGNGTPPTGYTLPSSAQGSF
jgi:hypothetical protein